MPDATADQTTTQELARFRALVGELSTQLQEAIQARTNLGVSLRLSEAREGALEAEIAALREAVEKSAEMRS